MLYANKNFKVENATFSWGEMPVIRLGETGRGRREIMLPVKGEISEIPKGISKLGIGLTSTGKPCITADDGKLHAIICTKGGYTRRGDGKIASSTPVEVLTSANGADGDAGRIGQWVALVIAIPPDPILIRITLGGGHASSYVYFNNGSVLEFQNIQELELFDDQVVLKLQVQLSIENLKY